MLDAAVARRIRLVGFDVDGVLTDGGIYLGLVADHAAEFKRFQYAPTLRVSQRCWGGRRMPVSHRYRET